MRIYVFLFGFLFLAILWGASLQDQREGAVPPLDRKMRTRHVVPRAPWVRDGIPREEWLRGARERADRELEEYREAAYLKQLMDRETAVGNCIAVSIAPCDCTGQAVEFVRAMQSENRMSMTRRRRLTASQNLAELCLALEEGVSLSDTLRP